MIHVYADGACRGNPGPGGWGVVIVEEREYREFSGGERATTNNRMELTAAIRGLAETPAGSRVEVTTDSRYIVDGMTKWLPGWLAKNWRKADRKPVLNKELWQALVAEAEKRTVTWAWVEGHAGHIENERCDALANEAIDAMTAGW